MIHTEVLVEELSQVWKSVRTRIRRSVRLEIAVINVVNRFLVYFVGNEKKIILECGENITQWINHGFGGLSCFDDGLNHLGFLDRL